MVWQRLANFGAAKILSALYSFKSSLLFYPVMLAAASVILFIVTSRIDESLTEVTVELPVVEWLLFAGSPNAARSILSTIAAGWATILGVVFSVTLISLQLSITKHTSEVIDEFENDKLNQVMIGWFVSTVIYSLLVLKTIRTGEDGIVPFAPVLGVNVAVFLAVIALFIFVAFLHNVSTYLKPPLLIDRIKGHIINSLNKYGQRQIDRSATSAQIKSTGEMLGQVRAPAEGILRRIRLEGLPKDAEGTFRVWIDFCAGVGDYVRRDSTVATVYAAGGKQDSNCIKSLEGSIASSLDISDNRDVLTDPYYGIEIVRNIAIKSINQSDINSIKSCVSGLFGVLVPAFKIMDLQENAFRMPERGSEDVLVFKLKEEPAFKAALFELATIYRACLSEGASLTAILRQYADEYRLLATYLLESDLANEFEVLTGWYSSLPMPPEEDGITGVRAALKDFRQELARSHPYALDPFDIHMRKMFAEA